MRYGFLFAAIAGLTLALSPGSALASHYAVADVPSLIGAGDAEKLKKGGVITTEEMLAKAATAKDRKALAKASGLSAATIMTIAKRCDRHVAQRSVEPENETMDPMFGRKLVDLASHDRIEFIRQRGRVPSLCDIV